MRSHQTLPDPSRWNSSGVRMTKPQLVEALRRSEARSTTLAAENDRLRHALEIEKANNLFEVSRPKQA